MANLTFQLLDFISQLEKTDDALNQFCAEKTKELMASYDLLAYDALIQKHVQQDNQVGNGGFVSEDNRKFLALTYWLYEKAIYYKDLLPEDDKKLRILDIACGPGHFLLLAKLQGHTVEGMNIPVPVFDDLIDYFQIPFRHHTVTAFEELPKYDEKFDVIVSHLINFNSNWLTRKEGEEIIAWGEEEWDFFLNDLLKNHLKPGGLIQLNPNPQEKVFQGIAGFEKLTEFFVKKGWKVKSEKPLIIEFRVD